PSAERLAGSPEVSYRVPTLYARTCERCHGVMGEGKADELVPRVAGQHVEYLLARLQSATGNDPSPMTRVPATVLAKLSKEDLTGLAKYLSALETHAAEH